VVSTVRECRGAQAIGRDSREKIVTKFDHGWKNLLIGHIVHSGQLTQHDGTNESDEPTEVDHESALLHAPARTYTFL
jgi:hypothetical protein